MSKLVQIVGPDSDCKYCIEQVNTQELEIELASERDCVRKPRRSATRRRVVILRMGLKPECMCGTTYPPRRMRVVKGRRCGLERYTYLG